MSFAILAFCEGEVAERMLISMYFEIYAILKELGERFGTLNDCVSTLIFAIDTVRRLSTEINIRMFAIFIFMLLAGQY